MDRVMVSEHRVYEFVCKDKCIFVPETSLYRAKMFAEYYFEHENFEVFCPPRDVQAAIDRAFQTGNIQTIETIHTAIRRCNTIIFDGMGIHLVSKRLHIFGKMIYERKN